ncbi:MAG: protein kinase [Planctomycetota bacterium]|nr:protein kinase [Planctomycetota bacterium]
MPGNDHAVIPDPNQPILEELLNTQADSWDRGERVRVENLLAGRSAEEVDSDVVTWLLVGECCLRRDGGEELEQICADVERRFPTQARDVLEQMLVSELVRALPDASPDERRVSNQGNRPGPLDRDRDTDSVLPAALPDRHRDPNRETPNNGFASTFRGSTPSSSTGTSPGTERELPRPPDYRLIRMIGTGGFGAVYLGRNSHDHSLAAVKVLRRRTTTRNRQAESVELEGIKAFRKCAAEHPHLVQIHHVGDTDEFIYYYTMPIADGYPQEGAHQSIRLSPGDELPRDYEPHTLETEILRRGKLPVEEVLEMSRQILSGLAELHQNGVIHSDVKPANILKVNGVWKLGDVGLAVATGPE